MTAAFCSSPRSGSPYGTRTRQKRQKPQRKGSRTELGALGCGKTTCRRRAEGKETRSTGSITRSQRRAEAHHAAKSKSAPAPDRGRSSSPAREAAPKTAAESSSSYEATDEEAPRPPVQNAAGEFLPAAPKAKAGEQRQEPSQPSVLPKTGSTAPAQKKAKPEEPRAPAAKALAKEEPTSTAVQGEEGKAKEVHDGAGEALPAATATKEESGLPGEVRISLTTLRSRPRQAVPQKGRRPQGPRRPHRTTNIRPNRRKKCRRFRVPRCQRVPVCGPQVSFLKP